MALRPKQQRFVEEYLVDLNATQAAIRAGYSAKNADKIGSELLGKTRVSEAIQAAKALRSQRVEITQDGILHELGLLDYSDVTNYQIDDRGNVRLASSAHPHAMRAVCSLKKKIIHTDAGVSYETEIKLWNKPAALKMSGDHVGLFKEGTVDSSDIQAAQEARRATVSGLRDRLKAIAARAPQPGTAGAA